jgi:hypothetical protein
MTMNIATLFSLLPLLLPSIIATPSPIARTPTETALRRDASGVTNALAFEQVSDSIGISAQMVGSGFRRISRIVWIKLIWVRSFYRCSWARRGRFMFWISRRITLLALLESLGHILLGRSSMIWHQIPVSVIRNVVTSRTYSSTDRTMDVYSNTFCAGGGVLGNGTWVVFGGNQRESLRSTDINLD